MNPYQYLVILLLAVCSPLHSSDLFTYQGKLTDAGGQNLPAGQYRIGVRIWDVATGGNTPLWARKYDVPVTEGMFSLMIGAEGEAWQDPDPLTSSLKLAVSGTQRYLEITVMSDVTGQEKATDAWEVLLPRQALTSVPYAMNGVPPGTVLPFAGTTVPEGWLLCDGTSFSSVDAPYRTLFQVIGALYGSNGADTFRVPDLRGRTIIGTGQGVGLTRRQAGEHVGAERHVLTISEMPNHNHGGSTSINGRHSHSTSGPATWRDSGPTDTHFALGDSNNGRNWPKITINPSGDHSHTIKSEGQGGAHNIMQPSLVLNYIIKL